MSKSKELSPAAIIQNLSKLRESWADDEIFKAIGFITATYDRSALLSYQEIISDLDTTGSDADIQNAIFAEIFGVLEEEEDSGEKNPALDAAASHARLMALNCRLGAIIYNKFEGYNIAGPLELFVKELTSEQKKIAGQEEE